MNIITLAICMIKFSKQITYSFIRIFWLYEYLHYSKHFYFLNHYFIIIGNKLETLYR